MVMLNPGAKRSKRHENPAKPRLRMVPDDIWRNAAATPAVALAAKQSSPVAVPDRVQAPLTPEIMRLRRLERKVNEISAALARAHADLATTRVMEKQARHLAMHDVLTSLPNRRHFQERLDLALSPLSGTHQVLTVMYIDLDGFKGVNDAHGHHTGDQLLQIVAARLKKAVRAEDMVCRLGGDEFACLMAGLPNRRRISQVAEKIFDVLSAPPKIGSLDLSVLPSIGIAVSPRDGATGEALLRCADTAMYYAKTYRTRYAFFKEEFQQA
jgi:diguanylate cyclase (GGDEF)-like protein